MGAVIAQWVGCAGSRRFFIRRQVSAGSAKLSVGKTSRIANAFYQECNASGDVVWRDSGFVTSLMQRSTPTPSARPTATSVNQ
jgi:hypothetical protein